MNQPVDYQARRDALDPHRSFAVAAPAGSGKTGLLTQRVLTLLPLCNEPEEVLCITFTRKAAAEMQERIFNAIQLAATTARPQDPHAQLTWDLARKVIERDAEQHWQLLQNPNRLRIQTIDGLCRSLTQHNPIRSGLGGSSQLLDNPTLVYQQAVDGALRGLETPGPLQRDLSELLQHLDNNLERLSGFLVSLLERRDQWLQPLLQARDAREYLENVLEELVDESLQQAAELLRPLASDLCLLADYAASNLQEHNPQSPLCQLAGIDGLPELAPEALSDWQRITDFLLTNDGDWRKPGGLNVKIGFPAPKAKEEKAAAKARKEQMGALLGELQAIPGLLEALRVVRILPPCHYPHNQWRLLDSLTRVMPQVVAHLKMAFRSLNATDFSEITHGALTALGSVDDPTELALLLDYQVRHILVDEFQDTASPQLNLLELLTAGWQPGDGRSLFIVGDGMQSCYGFRDANVGIFLDARQAGIGTVPLEMLDLQVNFRSQQGIVDWVNDAFRQAFPGADDISRGAVSYASSVAFKQPLDGPAATAHLFAGASDRSAEAAKVAELVQQALQDHPQGTVAILVRTRPQLRDILPALSAAGIRAQATEIDPLSSRMAVIDGLSLTRALLNPADRNAWLALLRSPVIGLDNSDLLQLAGLPQGNSRSLLEILGDYRDLPLSHDGKQILQRSLPQLQLAWENRRRKRLRQWIEGTWTALGGPATLLNPADHINLRDFFALLDRHDRGGQIEDWGKFEDAVAMLYAKPASDADPRVQVMTIHKSKGLEFDTVIIPGLDRSGRASDKELLLWQQRINRQHEKRLLLSPLAATGSDDDPLYSYLREEMKLKESLEATRVLYVGCTRPIRRLHLLANVQRNSKGDIRAPSAGCLLNCLWPQLEEQARYYECADDTTPAPEAAAAPLPMLPLIRRLAPEWQRPALVPGSLLASYRGREFGEEENRVQDDYFRARAARHTGTVLHRALAQVVSEGLQQWDDPRIARQRPAWLAQLRSLGLAGSALQDACNRVELGLRKTLADERGRWLLDDAHQDSACELSLWSNHRRPRQQIIDRTFIATDPIAGQQRWIIDYKSSEPANGQSLQAFIDGECASYREQLGNYRQLFADSDLPVTTALYFPLLSILVPVEALAECD
ncbi:exodeoxyribonuclease V subunit beta [Pseudomaricurvus sp. HS19]|uniref:UvrD-helicase domain-containing protein n=1 Tax=Pseudomaricurvus sp. HS19 TaxID=2692626 RepID=UPI001369FEF9|nr:UvrD-helicase domain-containing protein [Pseudomaricurvus sp. HS19]MYM62243.1 UvrD-helicase domain-containing protein [Pseudomaricurvus sp. HS19]